MAWRDDLTKAVGIAFAPYDSNDEVKTWTNTGIRIIVDTLAEVRQDLLDDLVVEETAVDSFTGALVITGKKILKAIGTKASPSNAMRVASYVPNSLKGYLSYASSIYYADADHPVYYINRTFVNNAEVLTAYFVPAPGSPTAVISYKVYLVSPAVYLNGGELNFPVKLKDILTAYVAYSYYEYRAGAFATSYATALGTTASITTLSEADDILINLLSSGEMSILDGLDDADANLTALLTLNTEITHLLTRPDLYTILTDASTSYPASADYGDANLDALNTVAGLSGMTAALADEDQELHGMNAAQRQNILQTNIAVRNEKLNAAIALRNDILKTHLGIRQEIFQTNVGVRKDRIERVLGIRAEKMRSAIELRRDDLNNQLTLAKTAVEVLGQGVKTHTELAMKWYQTFAAKMKDIGASVVLERAGDKYVK